VAYLLDSNVFIQAKNLHYGFDICPAFWDWLDQANSSGTVSSVEKVRDELLDGADELATWAGERRGFFLAPDERVLGSLPAVSRWAVGARYEPAAVSGFLQVADFYLVGHAHAYGYVVVTHEVGSASTRRIKIPNACGGLGVDCISPYEMLRREGARFVLAAAA
jgi:hypothetical protein